MGEQRQDVKQGQSAAFWDGYHRAARESAERDARRDAGPYAGVDKSSPGVAEALASAGGAPPQAYPPQAGAGIVPSSVPKGATSASMGDPTSSEDIRAGIEGAQARGTDALVTQSENAAAHMEWLNKNAWRGPDWIAANDPWLEAGKQAMTAAIRNRIR